MNIYPNSSICFSFFRLDWLSSSSLMRSLIIGALLYIFLKHKKSNLLTSPSFRRLTFLANCLTICSEVYRYCFLIENMRINYPFFLMAISSFVVGLLPLYLFGNLDRIYKQSERIQYVHFLIVIIITFILELNVLSVFPSAYLFYVAWPVGRLVRFLMIYSMIRVSTL